MVVKKMVVISFKREQALNLAIMVKEFMQYQGEIFVWFLEVDVILSKIQKALTKYTDKQIIKAYRNEIREKQGKELLK